MALAESLHHSAQRQETARAGGGAREERHGEAPDEAPPPQEPGTQYYDLDDESVPELGGARPAALEEPRPQEGMRRHTGEAYELVLDPLVPQLDRDLAVLPDPTFHKFFEALEIMGGAFGPDALRDIQGCFERAAERRRQREQEDSGARSSNKMGKKEKSRKRRKKKLPKIPSSSPRRGGRDQGTMIEYAGNEHEEVMRYSGWWIAGK